MLLLAWCPAPAAADVTAGVAAYKQRNFTRALAEFQESAKRDDVRALNYLGIMYAEGIGTPRDDMKAAEMFAKAALLGFPEAMANMGRMHAEGRGVPQDNKAAVAAYSAAARRGFQPAITRMVMIYEKGELGVVPDAAHAREWRAQLSAQPGQTAATTAPTVSGATAPTAVTKVADPKTPSLPSSPPPAASSAPGITAAAPSQHVPIHAQTAKPLDAVTIQATAPAQNAIESIAVALQTGDILVRVRTKAPLAAKPAEFVMPTPPRIVFDFPNTVTGLGRHHKVSEGELQSVDLIAGDSRTRMVLILRNTMQHETSMESGDFLIRLKPIRMPTSNTANQPKRTSP